MSDERDAPSEPPARRVLLLGCVKSKVDHPAPARDLYRSPLWKARRSFAESTGDEWLILSAMHGLVDPIERLEPYDLELKSLPAAERRAWGARVVEELEGRLGSLAGVRFELHAGAPYRQAITDLLIARGAKVDAPLAHVSLFNQPSWYRQRLERSPL